MRKVTEKAALALRGAYNYTSGNTVVSAGINGTMEMRLHGNLIASVKGSELTLFDAGWSTATTKERLNGILEVFDSKRRIMQKGGTWYVIGVSGVVYGKWLSGEVFSN